MKKAINFLQVTVVGIISEKIYKVKQVHLPVVEALAADDIKMLDL